MLTKVEIENFKAIEKLTMDFESPLTVLVGPNGSGKTSILQSIFTMWMSKADSHGLVFRRIGSTKPPKVTLSYEVGGVSYNPEELGNPLDLIPPMRIADLPRAIFLRCDYKKMVEPSLVGTALQSDGANLSSALATLRLNDPERFRLVEDTFRSVIPQITAIRFQSIPVRNVQLAFTDGLSSSAFGHQILFDTTHALGVPAESASEGSLLALAILTSIVSNESTDSKIILIDDLDASLHPSAQKTLLEAIRRLMKLSTNLQIIATSHSPYLLHSLEFNEVRLTTLRDDGTVACGRLMDHPDFDRWKDEMTPGEMWSLFGEKWIVNPPTPEPAA